MGANDTRPREGLSPTPPQKLGDANGAGDVGALGDRYQAGSHCRRTAAGGAAGTVAGAPGCGRIAVERAFGGAGHRIFGRRRAADDVDPGSLDQGRVRRILRRHQPGAQPAAEFDAAPGLVAEDVLQQKGHAAERAVAQRGLVQRLDAVGIGLDDGAQGRVDRLDGSGRGARQFGRRDLAAVDQVGQAEGVEGGIFVQLHRASPWGCAHCGQRSSFRHWRRLA
jgi:hypothetical protein